MYTFNILSLYIENMPVCGVRVSPVVVVYMEMTVVWCQCPVYSMKVSIHGSAPGSLCVSGWCVWAAAASEGPAAPSRIDSTGG